MLDCRSRHAINDTCVRALRHRNSSRSLNGTEPGSAVIPHSCHQHTNGFAPEFLRDGIEEDVHRWAVTVDPRLVYKDRDVAVVQSPNLNMTVSWTDQRPAREEQVARFSFFHVDS